MTDHKFEFKIDIIQITAVLVALKFFGALEWSWWWVFSPILGFYGFAFTLAIVYGILCAINDWNDKNVF